MVEYELTEPKDFENPVPGKSEIANSTAALK